MLAQCRSVQRRGPPAQPEAIAADLSQDYCRARVWSSRLRGVLKASASSRTAALAGIVALFEEPLLSQVLCVVPDP
jgi:hypothetical protein